MKTLHSKTRHRNPWGFTLIELLVAMTVIGILVGMLAFAVQRVLTRSREFAVQVEMGQLETAIEKFHTEYGFYPPSFKRIEALAANDPQAAANLLMTYINRIAPNNLEGAGVFPNRPVDIWWSQVGSQRRDMNPADSVDTNGSELVFWLSGLARDKQRPLTRMVGNQIVPNSAHGFAIDEVSVPRQNFFDFNQNQVKPIPAANNTPMFPWVQYLQPAGKDVQYLYLDATNYLPTNPSSSDPNDSAATDGGYCNAGVTIEMLMMAQNDPIVFRQIYPNPESFQLITYGLDGLPGGIQIPNDFSRAGPAGADNMVNFGPNGPGRLENLILEQN